MKREFSQFLLAAVLLLAAAFKLSAQGTAISYQGQLSDTGAPANAIYDFRFGVFTAPTNGTLASPWVTNSAVLVTNGLFRVTLDFGPGVFNGTANGSNDWMDVSVRTTGASTFTALTPRQPILPVPYAQFAVNASNLLGNLPAAQLSGTISSLRVSGGYSNVVNFANGSNTFAGSFSGNGAGLTNLNASSIASGTLSDARLQTNVALTDATQTYTGANVYKGALTFNGTNTFTGSNTFTGPSAFTGANTFTATNTFNGVNIFTNNNNSFMGSFYGNGLVGWQPIYGTTVTAVRDTGYLMMNGGFSAVTLPSSPLFVGDIIRVSGGGGGGWQIKESTGQSILGAFTSYRNSVVTALATPSYDVHGIAASADGVRMYATGYDVVGVYASSDSGHTWNLVSTNGAAGIPGYCGSVACSANGQIVYVEPSSGTGAIRKSMDGGVTWADTSVKETGTFISCTADGGTLVNGNVACSGNGTYRAKLSSGTITISTNGGASWTVTLTGTPAGMTCLAASSDCTRLVGAVSGGALYATSDMGRTWITINNTTLLWSKVWISSDGSKFAACYSKNGGINGGIISGSVNPLPGTTTTVSTGSISGSQGSAVELQCISATPGIFMPVSSTGVIWSN